MTTKRKLAQRTGVVALLTGAALALGAGSASAGVQIGLQLNTPDSTDLPAGYTAMQGSWSSTALGKKDTIYGYWQSKFPWGLLHQAVITSWGTLSPGGSYQLKLKVGSTGVDWAVPRYESELETVNGAGLQEFPSRVRIFDAENIGVYSPTGAPGMLSLLSEPGADGGGVVWYPADLTLPASAGLSKDWDQVGGNKIIPDDYYLNLFATVEPDRDGDNWGDETQDKCLNEMGEYEGCREAPAVPVKKTDSKKKGKGKKQGKRVKCKKGFKPTKVKVRRKGKVVRGKNGKPKTRSVCKRVKKAKGKRAGGRAQR